VFFNFFDFSAFISFMHIRHEFPNHWQLYQYQYNHLEVLASSASSRGSLKPHWKDGYTARLSFILGMVAEGQPADGSISTLW
jgi:hypothetical protein